jgi:hypothetical protein
VAAPVFVEVAVADHRAQGEDGFGAVQALSCLQGVDLLELPPGARLQQEPEPVVLAVA